MKKMLPFLCASALALSLTACAGTIKNSTADAASDVTFTFTDSSVIAAGETNTGYEIDGTALTITDSGTYTVSGSCADGSIKVKKGTTGVTLVLDGLTLTSENTAAITCGKSSEVTILVSNGTENSLSDTEQNNDDNYPENENAKNAVIKCKDGSLVTLCGDGELDRHGQRQKRHQIRRDGGRGRRSVADHPRFDTEYRRARQRRHQRRAAFER